MPGENLILGWARNGADCPDGVTRKAIGPLDLLVLDAKNSRCPRSRLQWHIRCFEQGIEYVPAAPAAMISKASGAEFAVDHRAALLDSLAKLRGAGQVTLALAWDPDAEDKAVNETGRTWLARRRQRHLGAEAQKRHATQLLDRLDCANLETSTRLLAERVERDILTPKQSVTCLLAQLKAQCKNLDGLGMRLDVTGLWPPFSFVQPFADRGTPWD